MRRSLILACLLLTASCRAQHPATWTVAGIFGPAGDAGSPPSEYHWAPKGGGLTYLSPDSQHGQPNDVISVHADGSTSVLAPAAKLTGLWSVNNDERDRDHRARYGQPSYRFSPDGRRMLFDTAGTIWLYDCARNAATELARTGMGSGDDPQFSPDGRSVSFIRDRNLHVLALNGRRDIALTQTTDPNLLNGEVDWVYDEELNVRGNYFWAPDSEHIAYLEMDETTVPEYPLTDWLPLHSKVELQKYPQPGDPNSAVRIGIVAATGGATRWLPIPAAPHQDYIPRFGWLDAGHVWVELLRRDQRHIELYFADVQTGAVRKIYSEAADKFFDVDYDVDFLAPSHGAGQFLWTSWRDGHTHLYLYRYNAEHPLAADAVLVRQLTEGPWEMLGVAAVDEKKSLVYYTSNETDPRQEMLWQIGFDGSRKQMLTRAPGVHRVQFSPDSSLYIDTVSNLTEPPIASLCSTAGHCRPFWQPRPLAIPLVAPLRISGNAADGTMLLGELLLPPDQRQPASVPLIVNPYGGPGAQGVRDQFDDRGALFDQLLMQHGFAVLHVDNRGMGNRGRAFAEAAYHNFGPVQLDDQLRIVDQVLARYPQLDAYRLGWWGWSWGGSFTLYAMSHSTRFTSGVAVAPVTDWRLYDSIYTERYLGLPQNNPQIYRDDSDVTSAGRLHGSLLLAHGTGDDNVHLQNSIQMIQQFVTAAVPYRLILFPRKTHSIAGSAARTELFTAILDEFEATLKPGRAAR